MSFVEHCHFSHPRPKYISLLAPRPFRALALSRGVSEVTIADQLCLLLPKLTKGSLRGTFQSSVATVQRERVEIRLLDNFQRDCLLSSGEFHSALAVARKRTAPGPDNTTYSSFANLGQVATGMLFKF